MASAANDRYVRIHSTFSPPAREGQNPDRKGDVLEKAYITSVPTVVVWDDTAEETKHAPTSIDEQDDDVWNDMEQVGDSDVETQGKSKRRHVS